MCPPGRGPEPPNFARITLMRRSLLIAGLSLAMLTLTACGQKGPLRMPDAPNGQSAPAASQTDPAS